MVIRIGSTLQATPTRQPARAAASAPTSTSESGGANASGIRRRPGIDLRERRPDKNREAARVLASRFQSSIAPLFESIRGSKDGQRIVDKYIHGADRALFVQRTAELEKQRELTDIEKAYLESVQLLTVFNPHIVALLSERPQTTALYLEKYFASLDRSTRARVENDSYVPHLQIGLGPNGLAAAGELNRINPKLAQQTLYVDGAELPGGPFGMVKGAAWALNSASAFSVSTNTLPDVFPMDRDGLSVRSYGSPLVAYPGERTSASEVRQASINATVDYLPNPDNISTKRYPSNVDIAGVLQMQAAMLVDQVMLSTRVVDVMPVLDGKAGNKRVTLERVDANGIATRTTVRTDSITISSGLGDPDYGFPLKRTQAQAFLDKKVTKGGFPVFSTTIEALSKLADPSGEQVAPSGTVVIYGAGNSTDVLIENLGREFESGNPAVRNIRKVIVVSEADLSRRPRYAQINDLKERNGQRNFLEQVRARVADVAPQEDGTLRLLDADGNEISLTREDRNQPIEADFVIAASGFRPQLDAVFANVLSDGESLNKRKGLTSVTLPNNPTFSIADTLADDPSIVVIGTQSRADFQNENKLSQLPVAARGALERNGAGNAVAIGFRAPDARAATRILFSDRQVASVPKRASRPTIEIDVSTPTKVVNEKIRTVPREELPKIRRNVAANSETLTALLLESLPKMQLVQQRYGQKTKVRDKSDRYEFSIAYSARANSFNVICQQAQTPRALFESVQRAMEDPYVQAYCIEAASDRRRNRGFTVALAFDHGKLQYRDPGLVPGKTQAKPGTYLDIS